MVGLLAELLNCRLHVRAMRQAVNGAKVDSGLEFSSMANLVACLKCVGRHLHPLIWANWYVKLKRGLQCLSCSVDKDGDLVVHPE